MTTGARPPAAVRLAAAEKRFGSTIALHPVDLDVEAGELMVLVGPSGCGKTTILRLVAGLEDPTAGEIFIGGRRVNDVEPADRDVAMVFQSYALYPHKNVRENLAFGLRMRKLAPADITRRVSWAASALGLESLLERRPSQLSGGQKQRVAFGRAMVREPQVFLFDEPLSNLDARLRADMRREVADLHERLGSTMVYVTHDQVEAMTLGERIAVMRDGRILQVAPPLDVYRRPANLDVATFIGTPAINLVEGTVVAGGGGPRFEARAPVATAESSGQPRTTAGGPSLALPLDAEPGVALVVLGVRPEAMRLVAPDAGPDFVTAVHRSEPLGNEILVHVNGPCGAAWTVRAPADWPGRSGEHVGIQLLRPHLHVFDAASGRRLEIAVPSAAAAARAARRDDPGGRVP